MFKNVDKAVNLKAHFTCDSSNLLLLSFALRMAKNTPVKLELVKPNSETAFESVNNKSDNLSIKRPRMNII